MSVRADVAPYVALVKPAKLLRLFGSLALAAAVVLPLSRSDVKTMLVTIVAGCLAAAGANALNMFLDRHVDARDPRTAGRPLPAGRIHPGFALGAAVALVVCGGTMLLAAAGGGSAALLLAVVALYASAYGWLKRLTPYFTLAGGAIWASPIPVLWVALGRPLSSALAGAFLVAALWTTLHVWSSALTAGADIAAAAAPRFLPNEYGHRVTRVVVVVLSCALALVAGGLRLRAMLPFDIALIASGAASVMLRRAQVDRMVSVAAMVFMAAFIAETAAVNLR